MKEFLRLLVLYSLSLSPYTPEECLIGLFFTVHLMLLLQLLGHNRGTSSLLTEPLRYSLNSVILSKPIYYKLTIYDGK